MLSPKMSYQIGETASNTLNCAEEKLCVHISILHLINHENT